MKKIFFIVLLSLVFFSFAHDALAVQWWPLVPCGLNEPGPGQERLDSSYYQPCGKCDLLKLFKNIIDGILFGLVPVGGTFIVVYAGFLILMGGANPALQSKGMGMLRNAFYGILFIAFSWLIVNTLLKALVGNDNIATQWWQITCTETIKSPAPTPTSTGTPPVTGGVSEQDARAQLAAAGVAVNAAPPQTTLVGMRQATLDEIIRIKQSCDCSVTVTAGTEPGHTSKHTQGLKFDLRLSSDLNAYILGFEYVGVRSDDGAKMYKSPSGAIYALEDDHWDVEVP